MSDNMGYTERAIIGGLGIAAFILVVILGFTVKEHEDRIRELESDLSHESLFEGEVR